MKRIAPVLLLGLLSLPATADIYKCRLPDGRIEIANEPCPKSAGTLDKRPDETVSPERKADAERDLERQRTYLEKREAAQRADEKLELEREAQRREAAAKAAPATPPPAPATTTYVPVPVAVSPVDQCIQNVYRMPISAADRNRRISQCQTGGSGGGLTITINPPHAKTPTTEPTTPSTPAGKTVICPKNDKFCAGR
jgi:hypothetical protein